MVRLCRDCGTLPVKVRRCRQGWDTGDGRRRLRCDAGEIGRDTSYDDVGLENIPNERIDTGHYFITGKEFTNLEEMKKEVEQVGRENNIHIINYTFNAKRGLQIYACDRSGPYRPPKGKTRTYSYKFTGTRKINCPFRLKGLRQDTGTWKLFVQCGFHNHELDDNPFGHAKTIPVNEGGKRRELTDIIFCAPGSVDMLHQYRYVLVVDSTYNTNMYKMPLLEVVGVTPTHRNFSVFFAFLQNEKEIFYNWALKCMREVFNPDEYPEVIISDRELALINAIEKHFPTSKYLLCRRHIEKNVEAWVKGVTGRGYMGEFAKRRWDTMVKSLTEEDFMNNEKAMVEGAHAALKRYLRTSVGSFDTVWEKIHDMVKIQRHEIERELGRSKTNALHVSLAMTVFRRLNHYVSHQAIRLLDNAFIEGQCNGCALRSTHGLPCSHEIATLINEGKYIELNSIHPFWKTLDFKKKDSIDDTLSQEQERFSRLSDELLKRVPEMIQRCCDAMEDIIYPCNIVDLTVPSKPPFPYPSSVINVIDSITDWYDPQPDGNCGFRAIAHQVYSDENEWVRVRRELLAELMKNSHKYANTFGSEERFHVIAYLLSHWEGRAPDDKWMDSMDLGFVIATVYNVVCINLSLSGSVTYLPLIGTNQSSPNWSKNPTKYITVILVAKHFYWARLACNSPLPRVHPSWEKYRDATCADWLGGISARLLGWKYDPKPFLGFQETCHLFISLLSLAGFEPRIKKKVNSFPALALFDLDKKTLSARCPPGKVAVMEKGEIRCIVKERVEIPFDFVATDPDVNY
ncbi:uncharacterized protein LOC141619875 [Silene latifolia]|uniref:uncharacterized protein LOC141619875 n=1 Tax=Silene latifolia TaxID=37657 RepID=UPI003D78A34D